MNYDNKEIHITIETDDLNMTYIIFKSGDCKQLNELSDFALNDIKNRKNYKNISYIGGLKKNKDQKILFPYRYHGKGFLFYQDSGTLCCESYFRDGKRHGYTFEYDRDAYLLYKGKYFNGKKMGPGETFFPGHNKVQFAGTFEKNKLYGLGIEYDFDSYSNKYYCKYIGTFSNNKYDGNGTIYTSESFKLYDGQFSNGVLHGHATQYITNSSHILYTGDFKNGEASGSGKIYTFDDQDSNHHYLYYDGHFLKGCANGHGKLFDSNSTLIYEGEFLKSQPHGIGTMFAHTGLIEYDGELQNGNRHGKGVAYVYSPDSNITRSKYEGFFKNNKMHGSGEKILYKYDSSTDTISKYAKLVGTFHHNTFSNGTQFVCEIDDDNNEYWLPFYNGSFHQTNSGYLERHGNGILYEIECIASGSFRYNEKHGSVSEFDVKLGHLLFEGNYKNGKRDGFAKVYNPLTRNYDQVEYKDGLTLSDSDMKFETFVNSFTESNESSIDLKQKIMKFDKIFFSRYMKKNNIRYNTEKKDHKRSMFTKIRTYKHIKKCIAQRKKTLSDTISLKLLRDYVESQYTNISFTSTRKRHLWATVIEHEYPTNSDNHEDEEEEDLFGHPIINRCVGSDNLVYDKRSMDYLFEKNDEGEYIRISYCFDENDIRVPNYPISSNGKILNGFTVI